jgi:hypothetical protein
MRGEKDPNHLTQIRGSWSVCTIATNEQACDTSADEHNFAAGIANGVSHNEQVFTIGIVTPHGTTSDVLLDVFLRQPSFAASAGANCIEQCK